MFVLIPLGGILQVISYVGLAILYVLFPGIFSIIKFVKKSDGYKSRVIGQIPPLVICVAVIIAATIGGFSLKTVGEQGMMRAIIIYYGVAASFPVVFLSILCFNRRKFRK